MFDCFQYIAALWLAATKLYGCYVSRLLGMTALFGLGAMVFAAIGVLLADGVARLLGGDGYQVLAVTVAVIKLCMMLAGMLVLRWLLVRLLSDVSSFGLCQRFLSFFIYICYMFGFFVLYQLLFMGAVLFLDGWVPIDLYRLLLGGLMVLCLLPCTYVAVFLPMSLFYILCQQPCLNKLYRERSSVLLAHAKSGIFLQVRLFAWVVYQVVWVLPLQACANAMRTVRGYWWRAWLAAGLPTLGLWYACQWLWRTTGLYASSDGMGLLMLSVVFTVSVLSVAFSMCLYSALYQKLLRCHSGHVLPSR